VAWLGRYANQPATVSLALPVVDLELLVEATAGILDKENEAAKPR